MATVREEPSYREQMITYFMSRPECAGTEAAEYSYWDRSLDDRCRYFVVDEEIVFEGSKGFLRAPWYYDEHLVLKDGHRKATASDGWYCICGSNTFRVFPDTNDEYETTVRCSQCKNEESVHNV